MTMNLATRRYLKMTQDALQDREYSPADDQDRYWAETLTPEERAEYDAWLDEQEETRRQEQAEHDTRENR